jgi:hypothetical protein
MRAPLLPFILPALLAACASRGAPAASAAGPATPVSSSSPAARASAVPQPDVRWPVRTVPHVDLWLHSFALLSEDSAAVPIYRRGYRDSLVVEKNRRNVLTALDGNREALVRGLRRNSYLEAQFLPFGFASWDDMRAVAERFLQLEGDLRRAPDRTTALRMSGFAQLFPGRADQEWLRLFLNAVHDEHTRFFDAEQRRLLRERAAVISAVDSLWQQTYRTKFERYLNNTGQRVGDLVLSLPIGGEGRTGGGYTGRTMVAVTYPARVEDAIEVVYVFAHEVTGSIVGDIVSDNTTPAEQRAGAATRYVALGQVHTGSLLLARVAPELVTGYQRYYLAQVGVTGARAGSSAAATKEAFERAFTLPSAIREALSRQVDIILSGI